MYSHSSTRAKYYNYINYNIRKQIQDQQKPQESPQPLTNSLISVSDSMIMTSPKHIRKQRHAPTTIEISDLPNHERHHNSLPIAPSSPTRRVKKPKYLDVKSRLYDFTNSSEQKQIELKKQNYSLILQQGSQKAHKSRQIGSQAQTFVGPPRSLHVSLERRLELNVSASPDLISYERAVSIVNNSIKDDAVFNDQLWKTDKQAPNSVPIEDVFEFTDMTHNQTVKFNFFCGGVEYVRIRIEGERFPLKFQLKDNTDKILEVQIYFDYRNPKPSKNSYDLRYNIKGDTSLQILNSWKTENQIYSYMSLSSEQNSTTLFRVWFEDQSQAKIRLRHERQQKLRQEAEQQIIAEMNLRMMGRTDLEGVQKKRLKFLQEKANNLNFLNKNIQAVWTFRENEDDRKFINSQKQSQRSIEAKSRKNSQDQLKIKTSMKKIIHKEIQELVQRELQGINLIQRKLKPFQQVWLVIVRLIQCYKMIKHMKDTQIYQREKRHRQVFFGCRFIYLYRRKVNYYQTTMAERVQTSVRKALHMVAKQLKNKNKTKSKLILKRVIENGRFGLIFYNTVRAYLDQEEKREVIQNPTIISQTVVTENIVTDGTDEKIQSRPNIKEPKIKRSKQQKTSIIVSTKMTKEQPSAFSKRPNKDY